MNNSGYVTTLISHGPVAYNGAYYVHNYEFEFMYEISNAQTWASNFQPAVALRAMNFSLQAPMDTGSTIDLDTGV